jgi:hypothetical protein
MCIFVCSLCLGDVLVHVSLEAVPAEDWTQLTVAIAQLMYTHSANQGLQHACRLLNLLCLIKSRLTINIWEMLRSFLAGVSGFQMYLFWNVVHTVFLPFRRGTIMGKNDRFAAAHTTNKVGSSKNCMHFKLGVLILMMLLAYLQHLQSQRLDGMNKLRNKSAWHLLKKAHTHPW